MKYQYIIEKELNYGGNYDVVKRKIDNNTVIYYLSCLVDTYIVNDLIKGFMIKRNTYLNGSVIEDNNIDSIVQAVFSGCLLLIDSNSYFIIETRNYPTRSISESESEKSLKGSHDSFNESILTNTGLIRRRIKDEKFRCELVSLGSKSKTDISINYIVDKANPNLLFKIKRKLKQIDVNSLVLADKALGDLLFNQGYQIFPKVRYTERPDVASIHLLKGYIVLLVDTSSVAIIVPTTFFELNEQLEEYQLPPLISSMNRIFKFFCIIIGLYLLPLWFIMCIDKNSINNTIIIVEGISKNKLFFQIISVIIFLLIIRLASFNSTSMLSTSMSILASIILSSLAVEMNLLRSEVVFYGALSSICCSCISNYETSRAISFWNILLVLSVGLFGKIGFLICNAIMFISIVNINTLDVYYLYPFIPFDLKDFIKLFIKFPFKKTKTN